MISGGQFEETKRTFRSVPQDAQLGLMAGANATVANSSSGIIEAPLVRLNGR